MRKLVLATVVSAVIAIVLSIGTVNAQTNYQDFLGNWNVNIESCRPCVMTITGIDRHGNVTGTHTSLQGEVTPLTGKIVKKKGDFWLVAKTEYGQAVVELAFCESEADGYYTQTIARVPVHHKAAYQKAT